MAKFQDRKGGQNIDQYNAGADRNKTNLEADLVDIDSLLAIPDADLQLLIDDGGTRFDDVTEYKDGLRNTRGQIVQQIRLWQMDTQVLQFDEIVPSLLLFDPGLGGAVVSKCGEEVGNEATGVLQNAGKWFHLFDHSHEIVLDLGNKEVIDAVSIPLQAGDSDDHQLRGVDVYAAGSLAKIDDTENLMLTAVDFATLDDDNIQAFAASKKARYLKLTNIDTDDGTNKLRIKKICVRVIPKFFGEE